MMVSYVGQDMSGGPLTVCMSARILWLGRKSPSCGVPYSPPFRVDNTPGQGQPGGAAWDRHSHDSGCNPHCTFLFLLGTLGFDATTLLDFLISSETCFLEYLVRYLKLLREDWSHFITVCAQLDNSAKPGQEGVGGARDQGSLLSPACVPQSLVAYDSSDDSEGESPEQLLSTGELEAPETTEAGVAGEGGDLLSRAMRCLSHLHGAILRLQQKTLFPYNPAALVRLLGHVEVIHSGRGTGGLSVGGRGTGDLGEAGCSLP